MSVKCFTKMGSVKKYGVFIMLIGIALLALIYFIKLHPDVCITGGDWAFPCGQNQLKYYAKLGKYAWSDNLNLFGVQQITLSPSYLMGELLFMFSSPLIGVAIILFASLCASFLGIFLLLKGFGAKFEGSVIAFVLFSFSALSFNYLIMGWIYALVAVLLLPLSLWAFIRALNGSFVSLVLSGMLFSFSPIQSQAVIWYFISFLAVAGIFTVETRNVWQAGKTLFFALTIFVLVNAYWFPSLFLYPPSYIVSSDIVSSAVSLGIMGNYTPLNTLLAWGSLYNFQFETIQISSGLMLFSFLMPGLAIIGILTARTCYKWAFVFLIFSPAFLMFLGRHRGLLAAIPFANALRDLPRFSVLYLLGISLLAGLAVNQLVRWAYVRWGNRGRGGALILFFVGMLGAAYPWWSGEIINWQGTRGRDIRLRFKAFPQSWFRLESRLARECLNQKAVYYPIGGTVSFKTDPRFSGAFQEIQDSFLEFSPVPGPVGISDRHMGFSDSIFSDLASREPDRAQLQMLANSGVRLFIFRRNLTGPYPIPSAALVRKMLSDGEWSVWFEDNEVVAYAARRFKPTVFTASPGKVSVKSGSPTVEFRKLNPTLYRVRIHNAHEPFTLVLNETYNAYWRLGMGQAPWPGIPTYTTTPDFVGRDGEASQAEIEKYLASGWLTLPPPGSTAPRGFGVAKTRSLGFVSAKIEGTIQNDNLPKPSFLNVLKMPSMAEDNHHVVNGFANGWMLDPAKVCKAPNACVHEGDGRLTMDLVIEFIPQRVFHIGGGVTLAALLLLIGAVGFSLAWRVRVYPENEAQ